MAPDTHRRTLLAAAGSLAGSALLAGCRAGFKQTGGRRGGQVLASDKDRVVDPDVAVNTLETLVTDNISFAVDLFHYLIEESPEANTFVAPYSISIALAMTWAGARGTTEQQMADAMQFSLDQSDLHPAFNQLDQTIQQRGDRNENQNGEPFELRMVNALWGQAEYPFRETFLDTLAVNYGAGLRLLDFMVEPEAARTTINEWVADRTNGTIKDFLPPEIITAATRFALTNAIYFKASWATPFEKEATTDGQFTALDGSTTSVSMMRQSETFPYAEADGHQLIELPYVGDDTGMVIILPAAGAFETFEQALDPARLGTLLDALEAKWGAIHLPRFTYKSEFKLKDALSALGMPAAFDRTTADFSGMADLEQIDEALFIHHVIHKSHIAVDEEGTEAAAATGVVGGDGGGPPDNEFEMVVDRPFVYLIRDRRTGTILFLGRVVDIDAAQPA